jgi:hypothetical protein
MRDMRRPAPGLRLFAQPPSAQRGAVLLVMVLVLLIGGAWFGLKLLGSARMAAPAGAHGLMAARDALLGASVAMVVAGVTSPGRLPPPDFLDPAEGPANYDGNINLACARAAWTNGAALPAVGGTLPADIRCFGRLPWASLGLGEFGAVPQADPQGIVPWYAISANLITGCIPALNPGVRNTAYTGFAAPATCKTVAQPFPWLTVRDYRGNVLTTRAAFVLILPGPSLGGQNRTPLPLQGPAAYLDAVTVTPGCNQPCVPGDYNNARFDWPNNVGLSFIQCAPPGSGTDAGFAQPYQCNDRLLYVTIDELMELAERRALQYASDRLQTFFATNFFFPYAAPHDPAAASGFGECQNGLLSGLIPHVKESSALDPLRCTHPAFDFDSANPPPLTFEAWFNTNRWGDYIYYAVAADCTQASPGASAAADCGGASGARLAAGAAANARALLISAGAPILAAPFAASRGAAQTRPSALVSNYLDSIENTNGDNRFDAPTTALSSAYNDKTLVVAP